MVKITYHEFEEAVKTLGLIGLENRSQIKERYLFLSKKFHPDMQNGDTEHFQKITKAYNLIQSYVDNFKFRFTLEEFSDQHPFSAPLKKDSLSNHS